MYRLRRFMKETAVGAALSLFLGFPAALPLSHQVALTAGLTVAVGTQAACGPDDLSKLHDILLKTSKTLNTAIKTNGQLYEQGFYGPVGSVEAVAKLHKGAQIIKHAALHLRTAMTLARALTKETFEAGKLAVLKALADAAGSMPATGAQTLDLVLQSVATLITQAVAIVEIFQASAVENLQRVAPKINGHVLALDRVISQTSSPLEVFAE